VPALQWIPARLGDLCLGRAATRAAQEGEAPAGLSRGSSRQPGEERRERRLRRPRERQLDADLVGPESSRQRARRTDRRVERAGHRAGWSPHRPTVETDGALDVVGREHLAAPVAVLFDEYLDEVHLPGVPWRLQKLAFGALARIGRWRGYRTEFPEYARRHLSGR
jgi:hypothetical protein